MLTKSGEERQGQVLPASTLVAENQGFCPHLMWSQLVEQLTGIAALAIQAGANLQVARQDRLGAQGPEPLHLEVVRDCW